jgi:hypothetical protein
MQYSNALPKLSGSNEIDALINTSAPNFTYETPSYGNTIYYSFGVYNEFDNLPMTITNLPAAQQDNVQSALNYVTSVTGINFQQTSDPDLVEMFFGKTPSLPSGALAQEYPNTEADLDNNGNILNYCDSQYILFNSGNSASVDLRAGSLGYQTLLQDVGAALGLKTPGSGTVHLPGQYDNMNSTLMSSNQTYPSLGPYWAIYQPFDLEALGWLYGGQGLLNNNYNLNYALNQSTTHETSTPATPSPSPAVTPIAPPLPFNLPWWEEPLTSDNTTPPVVTTFYNTGSANPARLAIPGLAMNLTG